jgi:hypothetical protein
VALSALPATAANGDLLTLGEANTAETATTLAMGAFVPRPSGYTAYLELSGGTTDGPSPYTAAVRIAGQNVGLRVEGGNGGVSASTDGPNMPALIGEDNTTSVNGRGVVGVSHNGDGVVGYSSTGHGVRGWSDTASVCVFGDARHAESVAVLAQNTQPGGMGLQVRGMSQFSTSGIATIARGSRSVKVTPGFDIGPTSKVMVTLQSWGGTLRTVIKDDPGNAFTIWLTSNATQPVSAAWFVIN